MNEDELYYRGRPVSQMTREELIEAVKTMARQMSQMHQAHIEDLDYIGSLGTRKVVRDRWEFEQPHRGALHGVLRHTITWEER